jgi:retinol-binding protein 3
MGDVRDGRRTLPLCLLIGAATATACRASGPPPQPLVDAQPAPAPELSAEERTRLIEQIGRELEGHYVFPQVAAKMVSSLRERTVRGGYDSVITRADLAHVITEQLRDISHDRHLMLEWTPPTDAMSTEDQQWERTQAANRATSGFGVSERLPGNVAHLVMNSFEPLQPARAVRDAVTQHLSEVADADALIVDLRDNSGGDPYTVAFVASYLFDGAPVHLNDMWWHDDGSTDTFFTSATVPGKRFGGNKPVFVLTAKHTFSAAEEFAYDLQCLKRGTIVGESTAGGAHPVLPRKLSPLLTLRVPTGRAINPITKTNWEGTGVIPDVPVEVGAALHEAHLRALRAILAAPGLPPARKRDAEAALASSALP